MEFRTAAREKLLLSTRSQKTFSVSICIPSSDTIDGIDIQ
jgi:hypothetical protein